MSPIGWSQPQTDQLAQQDQLARQSGGVSVAGSVMLSFVLSRVFFAASKRVMPQKATEQHNARFRCFAPSLAS